MGRGGRLGLLTAAVVAVHLALLPSLLPAQLGDGAAARAPDPLRVSFVNELRPAEPALRRTARARMRPRAPVAALAMDAQALPVEPAALAELPDLPVLDGLAEPIEVTEVAEAAASTPDATTFDWPPSTRLVYRVNGDVNGPVEGDAVVEWRRQGERYQVQLSLSVALLASRQISSDGLITPAGLAPRRYDEETRIVFRPPRRVAVQLDADTVRLADGRVLPRPEGVQDSASQFVQMTWLFNARPELLQPGQTIRFPLALPRRLETWTYDVLAAEPQATPAGWLPVVHVKPRREAGGGDLTAEFWVAPSLQHLPVRIGIHQGTRLRLDLVLDRLPQQAEPGR